MDDLLYFSEEKKWQIYTAVLEEYIFMGNFSQAEMCWLYQSANVTHAPVLIDSKIPSTRFIFRLESKWHKEIIKVLW